MADNDNDPGNTQDIGLNRPEDAPIPRTIKKPDNANVPPSTQYQDPTLTNEGKQAQTQLSEAQEALRQQQDDMKAWAAREDDAHREYVEGMKKIQGEISEQDRLRASPPDLLPMNQRPESDLHAQNHLQWSWPNTLFTLGVLALGAAGKGHHSVLSNYFLGSFFQAYAAGQQERQKEMELNWHQANEAIYRENELRLSEYRAKLADSHLSLDSKIQLMKNLADQYKDPGMTKALMTNNLAIVKQQLTNAERAMSDYRKHQFEAWKMKNKLSKMTAEEKEYQDQAEAVFIRHYGHEPVTPEEWAQAQKDYSLYSFKLNRKKFGTDDKGNPIDPAASPSPSPGASATPSPTPTDAQLFDAIKKYESGQK